MPQTGPRGWRHYNIHELVRLSTNVHLTTVPAHFRVHSSTPNFQLEMIDNLDGFRDALKHRVIGFTTHEAGNQSLYFETEVPVLSLVGTRARWKFLVQGLASETTRIVTSLPFFDFRPVRFKARQLLSKLALLVVSTKLLRHGFAGCHATAVARDDKAFLFFAYGGTGKSTVASSLMDAGYSFLSDDFTIVDGDGRVYCYPDWHAPRTLRMSVPLVKYLRKKPPFYKEGLPIRDQAEAHSLILLEGGTDAIIELDADEALRRITLVNMAEVSKMWNSPLSSLLNQYAYFYPDFDFDALVSGYRAILESFVRKAERYLVVRSRSPTFDNLPELLSVLRGMERG